MKNYLIIFMLGLVGATPCTADVSAYKVTSQKGDFFVWSGLDVGWAPVSTENQYQENSIFQSMGASRIVLKETERTIKGTPRVIIVESVGRIVFRLNDQVMRKVQVSNSFVKNVDAGIIVDTKDDVDLDIMSAWKKLASMLKPSGKEKGADNTKVGRTEDRTSLAAKEVFERIKVVYPAKGGILVPEKLPITVPVIWEHEGKALGCYEVFMKSSNETEFNRIGRAKQSRYDLVIRQPGSYIVRVQCASGSARSDELTFNILPIDSKEWSVPPPSKTTQK